MDLNNITEKIGIICRTNKEWINVQSILLKKFKWNSGGKNIINWDNKRFKDINFPATILINYVHAKDNKSLCYCNNNHIRNGELCYNEYIHNKYPDTVLYEAKIFLRKCKLEKIINEN